MAKLTRKWIELDWAQTNMVLRAEDIPYSVDKSIKDAITESNGRVAVEGGSTDYIDNVIQAGDNITLDVNGSNLLISTSDVASQHEKFVITAQNIIDSKITTSKDITDVDMVTVSVIGGTTLSKNIDYFVENNDIKWGGHTLETFIEAGDILNVTYTTKATTPGSKTTFRKIKVNDDYSASVGNELLVDTTSKQITITMPLNPKAFDEVAIIDYIGNFNTNSVIVNFNGKKVKTFDSNIELDVDSVYIVFVYIDDVYGWSFKM